MLWPRYHHGDKRMNKRSISLIIVILLLAGGLSSIAGATGVQAGETISTNKTIYVLGEEITIYVHAENYTYYDILVDGHWIDTVETNATGNYTGNYLSGESNLGMGKHIIQLARNNHILAHTQIDIREGLQLWPSTYTHSSTYINGEKLWVKLTGEDNKSYLVNLTTPGGHVVYPGSGTGITVHTNNTGIAVFNITLNIGDGSYLLNLYNGTTFIQSKSLNIRSVEIVASIDKGADGVYLLSEKIHVHVSIYWIKNHTLINGAQYKYWIVDAYNSSLTFGPYVSTTDEFTTYTLSAYSTGNGEKMSINSKYNLKIEYQKGTGSSEHMDVVYVPFYTGRLSAVMNIDPIDGSISPGNRVKLSIYTYASYQNGIKNSALGNVKIDYINITITKYWRVQWTDNYTNYGVTDISGHASMLWNVPNVNVGSKITILAGVSMGGSHYIVKQERWVESHVSVYVKLDKSFYLSGGKMGIEITTNSPANVKAQGYDVWVYSLNGFDTPDIVLYYGSTTQTYVTYTLPTNYAGKIMIKVSAQFSSGATVSATATTAVYYGYIYLSASQNTFMKPGERITIYSEFRSNVMHPSNLRYKIMDEHGSIIREINASMNQFVFTIPADNSEYYTIMAEAVDGSYYASNTLTINRFTGYFLNANILTKSRYQNMVYEPGQTVKIAYSVEKYGDFQPHLIVLHWAIVNTNYQWEKILTGNELNGTISITIPNDLYGGHIITIWVSDSEGTPSTENYLTVNIEKGSWAMQSIAGMPMLSFIDLILAVVAIVIGIFLLMIMLKKRGSSGEQGDESDKKIEKIRKPAFPSMHKKKKGAPKPYSPESTSGEEEIPPPQTPENTPSSEVIEKDDFGEI